MFNTILIFIMVVILIVILYRVNKNVEKLISYAKQNIRERQEDEDEYEYEENKDDPITDNVIKEMIIEKNKSLKKPHHNDVAFKNFYKWLMRNNLSSNYYCIDHLEV